MSWYKKFGLLKNEFSATANLAFGWLELGWEGEHNLAKVEVEGSNPFARSKTSITNSCTW